MGNAITRRIEQLGDDMHEGAVQAQETLADLSRAAQAVEVAAWCFAALCVYVIGRDAVRQLREPV